MQNDHTLTNSQALWCNLWHCALIIQAPRQMDTMFVVPIGLKLEFETQFIHVKWIQTTLEPSPKLQDGGKRATLKAEMTEWQNHTTAENDPKS